MPEREYQLKSIPVEHVNTAPLGKRIIFWLYAIVVDLTLLPTTLLPLLNRSKGAF